MTASTVPGRRRAPAVLAVQAVAVAALLVAWYGASGELRLADQWMWGGLSALALALSAVTNAAVLVCLRRRLACAAREF
jgi:hypothetical protein